MQSMLITDDMYDEQSSEIVIRETNPNVGKRACQDWHYTGCLPPNESLIYGFWRGPIFDGIIAFRELNSPAVNVHWEKIIGGRSIEISRIALRPQSDRPPTTQYIAMAMSKLRMLQVYEGVYSYADAIYGHEGTVYKAASFLYAGFTERGVAGYKHTNGHYIPARREMNATNGSQYVYELLKIGYSTIPGRKHRFVKGLTRWANKRLEKQRKELAEYKQYWSGKRSMLEEN